MGYNGFAFGEHGLIIVDQMRERLFKTMEETGGMYIPLKPTRWGQQNKRRKGKADAVDFPSELVTEPKDKPQ